MSSGDGVGQQSPTGAHPGGIETGARNSTGQAKPQDAPSLISQKLQRWRQPTVPTGGHPGGIEDQLRPWVRLPGTHLEKGQPNA